MIIQVNDFASPANRPQGDLESRGDEEEGQATTEAFPHIEFSGGGNGHSDRGKTNNKGFFLGKFRKVWGKTICKTSWWFQTCFFSHLPGEMIKFDQYNYFKLD